MTLNKKFLLLAVILTFLSSTSLPAHAAKNHLEITLSSVRNVYKLGDEVRLKLEFYNNSNQPLILYTGLLPEFNFNIDISRDGVKLSWPRRLYERTAPRKDEFVTLKPYEIYKDRLTLQDYMDEHVKLLTKGEYKLTVRYSNDIEGYQEYQPYSFIKVDAWKGKAASNTITIKVE